jgi:hypothetical protein
VQVEEDVGRHDQGAIQRVVGPTVAEDGSPDSRFDDEVLDI